MGMKSKHIIFVHGLFGWGPNEMGGIPYFGEAIPVMEQQLNNKGFSDIKVHAVSCGPVSSFHDRACEVYAQLCGCKVNYDGNESREDKKHSKQDNQHHASSSKDYSGKALVPDWSKENPVILIGHSAGAHTCLQLQQLLAEGFWDHEGGEKSNAEWVEAVVCISGVLNGSTLPYMLGCDPKSGLLTGPVGTFIGTGVQMLGGLNKGLARNLFDWDLEQWVGSEPRDLPDFIEKLQDSEFAKGKDNLAYDLTLQGCQEANGRFQTNPNTYYLSVVTEQTYGGFSLFNNRELPSLFMNPVLAGSAFYQAAVANFNDVIPIDGWGKGDLTIDKWRENDGAVSSISQRYPFTGGKHIFSSKEGFTKLEGLEKGKWYHEKAEAITGKSMDHLDVVFGHITDPSLGDAHRLLYLKLCDRLCSL